MTTYNMTDHYRRWSNWQNLVAVSSYPAVFEMRGLWSSATPCGIGLEATFTPLLNRGANFADDCGYFGSVSEGGDIGVIKACRGYTVSSDCKIQASVMHR
jgi:hypothetical protein